MPEHKAVKCPLPSSVHAPYLLSQMKEDPRVMWRTEEEYQQRGPSTYPPPPRNSLSPTNHPYPAQTADNTAPMSTTDTSYDNNREHEMPPSTRNIHEHASTNIGEGGGWLSRISEITTPVVAVPTPLCSHGDNVSLSY